MSATEELRKAFDNCTIMAGVEPDIFECVYIVKDAALRYLDEIDVENAKLRERVDELEELTDEKLYIPQEWYQLAMTEIAKLREFAAEAWELLTCNEPNFVWSGLQEKARELGIEEES